MTSKNTNHRSDNVVSNMKSKYTLSTTQLKTIFHYLQNNIATAPMVAKATCVPQKSICRYKRNLGKRGFLFYVRKGLCRIINFKVWYLTTNAALFSKLNQFKIF